MKRQQNKVQDMGKRVIAIALLLLLMLNSSAANTLAQELSESAVYGIAVVDPIRQRELAYQELDAAMYTDASLSVALEDAMPVANVKANAPAHISAPTTASANTNTNAAASVDANISSGIKRRMANTSGHEAQVTVSGVLPVGAYAVGWPVTPALPENMELVEAYAIHVYEENEEAADPYAIADEDAADTEIDTDGLYISLGADTSAWEGHRLAVLAIDGSGMPRELPVEQASPGEVGFYADGSGSYAVVQIVLEKIIKTRDGSTYQVSVAYDENAGIPEDAQLQVSEAADIPADVSEIFQWSENDIVLYTKFLDISIVSNGRELEPAPGSKVEVSVKLLDTQSPDTLQVVHMEDGGDAQLLDAAVDSEGNITFVTDSFSLFGFGGIAQEIISWTSDLLSGTILGERADQVADYAITQVDNLTRGLELLEAYTVTRSQNLWLSLQRVKDLMLGKLESIDLYSVVNGKLGSLVKENVTLKDVLQLSLSDMGGFALVRDTGLRERTISAIGIASVFGMIPKKAQLAVEETEPTMDLEQGSEALASYDISILNDGEEYEPEEAVQVTLACPEAAQALKDGYGVAVWHVLDDDTREEVECQVDGENVVFMAEGFSEYVVVRVVLEKTLVASDGNTYKITVSYDNESGLPTEEDGAKLAVSEVLTEEELADVTAAIDSERAENRKVAVSRTFDIKILDKDGVEVQPNEGANVQVTFELVQVGNQNLTTEVYHIKEDAKGYTAQPLTVNAVEGNTATVITDGFSYYTVEFTYEGKQYVLDGGEIIRLDEVLEAVGITGTIEAAEVSDSVLFETNWNKYDGNWYVYAQQPFDTQEWMKVTVDGVVYEIVVTDAFFPTAATGSGNTNFASGADIGTITIEDLTNKDRSISITGDWIDKNNGELGWDGTINKDGTKAVAGTATVRYSGVAKTAEGVLCDVELVFSNAVLYGSDEKASSGFHRIIDVKKGATRLPQVWAYADAEKFGLKVQVDINIYKTGTQERADGYFFATVYGVNVVRTNSSTTHIVGYNDNNHYTETIEIDGSQYDVYYNSSALTRSGNRIYPPVQAAGATYDTGIVVRAQSGFSLVAYQFAPNANGTNLQLMPRAGINHPIESYSGNGGKIETTTTGQIGSGDVLDGGKVGDERTYVVPAGKTVSYKVTSDSNLVELKGIYVDGVEIASTDANLTDNGDGSYTYTFPSVGTTHKINVKWQPKDVPQIPIGHLAMEPGTNGAVVHRNLQSSVPASTPAYTTLDKGGSARKMGVGLTPPAIDGYTHFTYALGAVDEDGEIPGTFYAKSDDLALRVNDDLEYQYCVNYTGTDADTWETWTLKDGEGNLIVPTVFAVYTKDDTGSERNVYTTATAIARNTTDPDFVDPNTAITFNEKIVRVKYTYTVKNPNAEGWNANDESFLTLSKTEETLVDNTHTHKPGEAHGHALGYKVYGPTVVDGNGDITIEVYADYMVVQETAPTGYTLTGIDKKHGDQRGTADLSAGTFTIYTAGTDANAGFTVTRTGDAANGYFFSAVPQSVPTNTEVEFINTRNTVNLTLKELLEDASLERDAEHPFSITVRARKQWIDGREHYSMLGTHTVTARNLDENGVTETLEIPSGVDVLMIQRFGVVDASTGVRTTAYDTTVTSDPEGVTAYRPIDKEYMIRGVAADTTVTFSNVLKPRMITVKKDLIGGDLSKTFNFTATITKDGTPVADYPVYTAEDGTEQKTDASGLVSFTLTGNGSMALRTPYGSHVAVTEVKDEGDTYTTGYAVDNGDSQDGATAQINGDDEKGITKQHEVVFTNEADFSVVDETGTVTYEFYLDAGFTQKYEYTLASNTDLNQTTYRQILRNGSALVMPEQPEATGDNAGKVFMGWFRKDGTEETDFGKNITVNDANKDTTIKLYARFAEVCYVVFHENQTTDENDNLFWPVMKTMAVEKNSEGKYIIDLTGIEPVVQDVTREFKGWAYSATVPEGADSLTDKIDGTEPYDFTDKGGSIDLYPTFTQKVRVSFWTGESGTGAPYVATVLVNEGSPIGEALPDNPAWKGRIFDGWYMNYNRETLECANPVDSTSTEPVNGDTTIYAKWHYEETSTYTIALWKQKVKPENVNSTDKVNYDFAGSVSRSGNTMSLVSLTDDETRSLFSSTGFTGFTFKKADPMTISPDGDTIIDVFYNREVYTIDIYPVPDNSQNFSYSGKRDDKYVETTEDAPGTKYGFVNGEYVEVHKELVGWKGMADTENHNNLALYQLSDGHWVYPINGITAYEDQWFYTQYSYTSGTYTYKTDYIGNTNAVTATAGSPAEGTTVWLSSNQLGYTGTAPRTDRFYRYITETVKSNVYYQDITYNAYIRYQAVAYYRWVDVYSNIYDVDGGAKLYRMVSGKVTSMEGLYGADIPWPVNETGQNYIILFNEKHEKDQPDEAYKAPSNHSFTTVTMIPIYRFESISPTGGKVALSTDEKKWVLYAADSNDIKSYIEFYKSPVGMTVEDLEAKIASGDSEIVPDQTTYSTALSNSNGTYQMVNMGGRWEGYSLYQYRSAFGKGKPYTKELEWSQALDRDQASENVYETGGSIRFINSSKAGKNSSGQYENAIRKSSNDLITTDKPIHVQLVFAPKLQDVIFLPHGVGGDEIKLQAYMDNTLKYSIHNGETGPDYTKYTQYLGATDEEGKLTPKYPSTDNLITPATGEEQKIFGGWYLDEMCSDNKRFDPDTTEITGTTYVYAKWEDPWYVVQIDPAGGELKGGTDGGSTWFWVQYGDTVTSYSNIITRNYDEYEQGDFYYRQDTYQDYHGTYDFEKDASVTIDDKTYNLNDYDDPKHKATYQPIADEDKETFTGTRYRRLEGVYQISRWDWQKLDSNDTPLNGSGNSGTDYVFGNPVTSHLKLTAVWEKVAPFKIIYDLAGGTLVDNATPSNGLYGAADASSVYMDGAAVTITKAAKSPDRNKQFLGWRVKGGATTVYPLNSTYTVASQDADASMTITLVAQYGAMELTSLRYDANGGEGNLTDVAAVGSIQEWSGATNTLLNIERNDTVTLSSGAGFTRNGYYIVGWSKNKISPDKVDDYFQYNATTQKWEVKADVADTFALGQKVTIDGATGNELYAVWKKGGLTVKVFTYQNGVWATGEQIHGGTYLQAADDTGNGWTPDGLMRYYNTPAKFTVPDGYAYAFGKVDGKTVKFVKLEGGEWKYAETEGGTYAEIDENSLDIYYYKTTSDVPVYYVTWDKATGSFTEIPEAELIGSDGNRWLKDSSDPDTALKQGDTVTVESHNYNVRLEDSHLVVPGGSDNRLLYESDGNGDYKARNLRGYAVAPDGATSPTSEVKFHLALRTTESGVVWAVSDDSINTPVAVGTDNVLTNPAIYVIYGEPDTISLTVNKTVSGAMGDMTKEFTFTLSGLTNLSSITGKLYTSATDTTGTEQTYTVKTVDETTHAITFTLQHGQRVELTIPCGESLTLAETPEVGYETWMKTDDTAYSTSAKPAESGTTVSTNTSLTLGQLTGNTTVQVLNWLDAVSPTGVHLTYAPYVLMMLFGILLLLLAVRRIKAKN